MSKHYLRIVCLVTAAGVAGGQARKNIPTQAEYDLYSAVAKDFAANNFQKALTDLEAWSAKYPDSEVRDARQFLFVQAYYGVKQPAKVLETAEGLLSRDAEAILDNPADYARLLYATAAAVTQIPNPSAKQIALAEKASRALVRYNRAPTGVETDAWTKTLGELKAGAEIALRHITLLGAAQPLAANDCATAEAAAQRAIQAYPESAQAAWYLGSAALCLYKTQPERASLMLYEFARAASLDPLKGSVDPQWQKSTALPALLKYYAAYHGEDAEGLSELRMLAVRSPLPPEGFLVKSSAEIAQAKQAQFELEHPEFALWTRIKAALTASDGEQYFASELKDAVVPPLKGVVVEAKPECRSRELLVAVPLPGSPSPPVAEILLKLDKPLPGKPAALGEIVWQGVPSVFIRNPFLLTMDTELAKLSGLTTQPCSPVPGRRGPKR